MLYSFADKAGGGELYMRVDEGNQPHNYYRQPKPAAYYTIAFNNGVPQQVIIDGVKVEMPAYGIMPVMFNQSFHFSAPLQVVTWKFNREFYCIVNHDREVGCAGLLFYGAWGQIMLETDEHTRHKLLLLLDVFREEFGERDEIQGAMLRMLLVRLIITITRIAREIIVPSGEPAGARFDLVRKYNLLVETHYKQQHEVKFYAGLLHKSPKTLSNAFLKYAAKPPLQVIHERLAIEARRLLTNTELSVKEIAAELGFEDAGHFTRFFRKHTGVAPSGFKKEPAGAG